MVQGIRPACDRKPWRRISYLYGSLSEIFTKVGDIIKGKQVVGRVGNSGIVNSPGLYFEVRYKGKPLDPLQWLQRR
jgi:murein DD-endopeptidase MepM/ murein hydrolase activator NlpD